MQQLNKAAQSTLLALSRQDKINKPLKRQSFVSYNATPYSQHRQPTSTKRGIERLSELFRGLVCSSVGGFVLLFIRFDYLP
jgi:hypothetical protein